MPLSPKSRLGTYEILGPLGAGGMGEVYRAKDLRLGREVAIKVLPQQVAATSEDRARFAREARIISSLNHPNICTLYDIGHDGGVDYLVLELVEGESLAARIRRGPLPIGHLLRIGTEMAEALDKAHRAGIIHRDLKPTNVMLAKSGAKLLDFGLARGAPAAMGPVAVTETALDGEAPPEDPITAKGTVVGTLQYMAPEQLEGHDVDARTDVWALGCVLYEMATGKRAFEGTSQASLIATIMSKEPAPMPTLAPLSPPALERLVKACLAKRADDRIQTAHDVKLLLEWIREEGSQLGVAAPVLARRRLRGRGGWIAAAAATGIAAALAAVHFWPKPSRTSIIFDLTPPPGVTQIDMPRISPDGTCLAFNAVDSSGQTAIWIRRMNSPTAERLPGTQNATRPFWSPDSRYLAYFASETLYKIDTVGGTPLVIGKVGMGADGSWSQRGWILFDGTMSDSIRKIPDSGGVPSGAVRIDRAKGELYPAWPQFLPDGRHFLYVAYGKGASEATLMVGSTDSKRTKSLGPVSSRAEYASGHILSVRSGTLFARPFDLRALKFTGEPFPIAEDVSYEQLGNARFSAGSNGTLVYRTGDPEIGTHLTWVNRRGEVEGAVGSSADYDAPRLSPDGTKVAVARRDFAGADREIWIIDLDRDVGTRFASPVQTVSNSAWSTDGSRIAYSSTHEGRVDIVVRAIESGRDSIVYTSPDDKVVGSWSRDGRWILIVNRSSTQTASPDIFAIDLGGADVPNRAGGRVSVAATPNAEVQPEISPDGALVAYTVFEGGESNVYYRPFPGPGAPWRISTGGGLQPFWRGDGRELYYLTGGGDLMSVAVEPGSPPRFARPQMLFRAPVVARSVTRNTYVPSRDGSRFLMVTPTEGTTVGATTVVLGWLARRGRE